VTPDYDQKGGAGRVLGELREVNRKKRLLFGESGKDRLVESKEKAVAPVGKKQKILTIVSTSGKPDETLKSAKGRRKPEEKHPAPSRREKESLKSTGTQAERETACTAVTRSFSAKRRDRRSKTKRAASKKKKECQDACAAQEKRAGRGNREQNTDHSHAGERIRFIRG